MSVSEFTRRIILGGLFVTVGNGGPVGAPEGNAGMRQRNAFLENNIVQNIDEQAIDPFVHTMQKLSKVEGGVKTTTMCNVHCRWSKASNLHFLLLRTMCDYCGP